MGSQRNVSQQSVRKQKVMKTALYVMVLTLGLTVALASAPSARAEEGPFVPDT